MHKQSFRKIIGLLPALITCLLVGAIILPIVLSPPKLRDPKLTCQSNLKQIGFAMLQYGQDYDNRLPLRQGSTGRTSWRITLTPYVNSKFNFQCPTNPMREEAAIERDGLKRSYAVNACAAGGPFHGGKHLRLDKITHPEHVILVVESTAAFNDFDPLNPALFARPSNAKSHRGHLYSGHKMSSTKRNQSLFLFADCHVKMLNPLMTIGAADSQPVNYWTIDNAPFSMEDRKTAQYTLGYAVEHGPRTL